MGTTKPNPTPATPIRIDQIACLFFIQLCETLNTCVLFPFMAFMVEDFGYTGKDLGKYVGLLGASFCGAQFFSSLYWGKFSDDYGRKPAILIGTFGTVFGMLVFGLASSYPQAIIGRILAGLLSGNIGVMKTYVIEITDDTNRGTGFSYMSVSWSIGSVLAPIFGGLCSNPVDKYPSLFKKGTIFDQYPYFLPCLCCIILQLFSVVVCALYMKETRIFEDNSKALVPNQTKSALVVKNGSSEVMENSKVSEEAETFIVHDSDDLTQVDIEDGSQLKPSTASSAMKVLARWGSRTRQSNDGTSGSRSMDGQQYNPLNVGDVEDETERQQEVINDSDEEPDDHNAESEYFTVPVLPSHHHEHKDHSSHDQKVRFSGDVEMVSLANKSKIVSDGQAGINSNEDVIDPTEEECQCFLCASKATANNDLNVSSGGPAVGSAAKPKRSPLYRRVVQLTCINYAILCMAYILFDETLPLFLKLDVEHNGFSFTSLNIGTLLAIPGMFMIFFAYFVLPPIARQSKKKVFKIGCAIALVHVLVYPIVGMAHRQFQTESEAANTRMDHYFYFPLLLCLLLVKTSTATIAFMAVNMQVGHSVYDEDLGIVNGYGQSLAAFARGIGPAIGGLFWSISMSMHFIYLNFLLMVVMLLINLWIADMIPGSLDQAKKRPTAKSLETKAQADNGDDVVHVEF